MITSSDIKKLEKTFVTKKDLQISLEQTTATIIGEVFEALGKINEKMDVFIDECRSHRKILENHENRLIKLEQI